MSSQNQKPTEGKAVLDGGILQTQQFYQLQQSQIRIPWKELSQSQKGKRHPEEKNATGKIAQH